MQRLLLPRLGTWLYLEGITACQGGWLLHLVWVDGWETQNRLTVQYFVPAYYRMQPGQW